MLPMDVAVALGFARSGFDGFEDKDGELRVRVITTDGGLATRAVSVEEAAAICRWAEGDTKIQDALPHWSADDRELLMTGLTPASWDDRIEEILAGLGCDDDDEGDDDALDFDFLEMDLDEFLGLISSNGKSEEADAPDTRLS